VEKPDDEEVRSSVRDSMAEVNSRGVERNLFEFGFVEV